MFILHARLTWEEEEASFKAISELFILTFFGLEFIQMLGYFIKP